ncbi:MAG TPA: PAS domain S-box protein, partial [Gammaproteobacteria bacterium]|nr:PAS domain S-box protein [Gammaproteobacteria bacterium]
NTPMDVTELRALLDAAVDAIVVIDAAGSIATFNRAAELLFGYCAADVIGKPVSVLMPEPHASNHQRYVDHYLETGEARIIGIGREVLARRANGELFPISLSVGEARDERGRRFVGIIRDLSGQRAEQLRARELEARLAHVGRFNLMGEMAAGIAHEINQPLSAIATYAQAASRILEREQPSMTKLIEVCRKIDEQARRAGAVIDNLRKFIRQRKIDTHPLDVNRTIVDVVKLMEADARAEGIALTMDLAADLPRVSADTVQLQQVLLNLTRNAVDAIRSGVRKEPGISIGTRRGSRGGVEISVTDCGPGVARRLGEEIFHPFVTTKADGLGVGLAVSRTIVQSYGGKLTYRDNPEGGAIFEVDLPAIEQGVEK